MSTEWYNYLGGMLSGMAGFPAFMFVALFISARFDELYKIVLWFLSRIILPIMVMMFFWAYFLFFLYTGALNGPGISDFVSRINNDDSFGIKVIIVNLVILVVLLVVSFIFKEIGIFFCLLLAIGSLYADYLWYTQYGGDLFWIVVLAIGSILFLIQCYLSLSIAKAKKDIRKMEKEEAKILDSIKGVKDE